VNTLLPFQEEKEICARNLMMRDERILWIMSFEMIGRIRYEARY